ncbi:MBL fold metallo-hydrolase [Aeromonas rivipollensis]
MNTVLRTLTLATTLLGGAALASPLTVTVYNPGDKAIFPVSSELVTGDKEAILIDAQFGVNDGQALVDLIKQSGKRLTTVYISGGDPDFYFGLEPIKAAFPDVKILASQHVVDHIKQTKDAKLAYWGHPRRAGTQEPDSAAGDDGLPPDPGWREDRDQGDEHAECLSLGSFHQDGVWRRAGIQRGARLDGGQPDQGGAGTVDAGPRRHAGPPA